MITKHSIIKQKPSLRPVPMNGNLGMLNIDTGKYLVLNNIGAQILNYAAAPVSVDEIVKKLTHEFDITYADCFESIVPYIEGLQKEQLIDVVRI